MKRETRDWVRCAEDDFEAAGILFRRRTRTAANTMAFHCRQSAEEYLKVRLKKLRLRVPRTHHLVALVGLLLPSHPPRAAFNPALLLLNNYAAEFRDPGHVATRADARVALRACRSIRAEVRASLGLPKK